MSNFELHDFMNIYVFHVNINFIDADLPHKTVTFIILKILTCFIDLSKNIVTFYKTVTIMGYTFMISCNCNIS